MNRYPTEEFGPDEDCGRIAENVGELETEVVGHRIVKAEQGFASLTLTLDNGKAVRLVDTDDCCACTEVRGFTLHPEAVDHVITGVGTTDGAMTWHIGSSPSRPSRRPPPWSTTATPSRRGTRYTSTRRATCGRTAPTTTSGVTTDRGPGETVADFPWTRKTG